MVLVKVGNEVFNLSQLDIEHSNTIQHLLEYKQELDQPIHLGVCLQWWHDYMKFLRFQSTNYLNVNALLVIDYLDNVKQFKKWYTFVYSQQVALVDIMSAVNNTNFVMTDVNPLFGFKDIESIATGVKNINILTNDVVEYIITTLFDDVNIFNTYRLTIGYDRKHNIPQSVLDKLKFVNIIIADTNTVVLPDIMIDAPMVKTVGRPNYMIQFIRSTRISDYYDKEDYEQHGFLIPETDAKSLIAKGSSYCPFDFNNDHNTNITITIYGYNYTVSTYNNKYLYHRDYYMFLLCETDPINKRVYALSI